MSYRTMALWGWLCVFLGDVSLLLRDYLSYLNGAVGKTNLVLDVGALMISIYFIFQTKFWLSDKKLDGLTSRY